MVSTTVFVTYSNTPGCLNSGSAIHPAFAARPDFYIPVLGGKALYRGGSQLLDGMRGDNTGEHVSQLNPCINEHSVIWWAAHNPDIIQTDYVGFCHYRRLFDYPTGLQDPDPKTIYVNPMEFPLSISTYFLLNHAPANCLYFSEFLYEYIRILKPEQQEILYKWLDSKRLFTADMMIMHKDAFKVYAFIMEPIWKVAFRLLHPVENFPDRSASFVLQRMSSFVIEVMALHGGYKLVAGHYQKLGENIPT